MQDSKREYMPANGELSDPEDLQQVQPLITQKDEKRISSIAKSSFEVRFRNFDENEEATKIHKIIGLKTSYFKCIIVVPLLSILTAFFFLLFLYWYPSLRKKFFYNECDLS
jgi:hypothetical protein